MAKQIVSIKLPMSTMSAVTLKRTLRIYESIRRSRSTAYFSVNGKTFSINNLPETISFLTTINTKEILLVIEGEDAENIYDQILESIELSKENARENPGLHRQDSRL
ncbi:hypothetical protein EWI07_04180 [Sporolactobacillus sp. THM7-4]|nr:hypothetical protein EWI07_04180 [Sporolactobacillus sp. THM7-4]